MIRNKLASKIVRKRNSKHASLIYKVNLTSSLNSLNRASSD